MIVAGADLGGSGEVFEFAFVPDLDGAAVPAFVLADADARGIVAISTVGRRSARADPLVAALVTLFLLGEALLQLLHDFVPAAEFGDPLLVLIGEVQRAETAEPVFRDLGFERFGSQFEAFEDVREDLIEAIEVALVLHQRGAREVIEILDPISRDTGTDGFEQRQVFFECDWNFGGAKLGEKRLEHERDFSASGKAHNAT